MGLPRKFKKEEAEGLEAVEAQIQGAERLREELARHREALFKMTGCLDEDGGFIWTEELNAYGAGIAYAGLVYLAERGDRESMKWLAEKGLGAPEQPFALRIEHMSPEAAERELYAHLVRYMSVEEAHALAVQLGSEMPALPEGDKDE